MARRIHWLLFACGGLLLVLAVLLILGTIPVRGHAEEHFIEELKTSRGLAQERFADGSFKFAVASIRVGNDVYLKREYYEQPGGLARWEIETPTRTIVYEVDRAERMTTQRVIRDERSLFGMASMPGPPWLYQGAGGLACGLSALSIGFAVVLVVIARFKAPAATQKAPAKS